MTFRQIENYNKFYLAYQSLFITSDQALTDENDRPRTVHPFTRPCGQRTNILAPTVHHLRVRTVDQVSVGGHRTKTDLMNGFGRRTIKNIKMWTEVDKVRPSRSASKISPRMKYFCNQLLEFSTLKWQNWEGQLVQVSQQNVHLSNTRRVAVMQCNCVPYIVSRRAWRVNQDFCYWTFRWVEGVKTEQFI